MAIKKVSKVKVDLSAKVAYVGSPFNILKQFFFLETNRPVELKFHMGAPYDRLAKIYTNCSGHMTKMATMPIYGRNPLNIFFSGTKRPMTLGLGV